MIQITFSFNNAAEAAAFLMSTGNAQGGQVIAAAPATVPAASSSPSAVAAPTPPAAAPASIFAATPAPTLDFDRDVVEALKGLSTKISQTDFGNMMAKLGAAKVSDLKAKPEKWAALVAFAKEPNAQTAAALLA